MMSRAVFPATLPISLFLVLGGSCFAQPAGLSPGDTYQVVFVTSGLISITSDRSVPPASFNNFGGIPAADWVVTFNAAASSMNNPFGLSVSQWITGNPNGSLWNFIDTHWQAILSDGGFSDPNCGLLCNAIDNIAITAPVYNTNGELVATDQADMWDGSIGAPIKYDEFGNEVTGNLSVWSGTSSGGLWTGSSCNDWDDSSSSNQGDTGNASSTNFSWIDDSSSTCNQSARLYALSPELTVLQPGDADGDFDVDGADFLAWQRGVGTGPANARLIDGDLDGDGNVDSDDLAVWEANYGTTNPVTANAATVPEPGCLAFVLMGLCVALSYRR